MGDSKQEIERDLGVQPLDGLLEELGLSNRDLVAASTEQLTHKQVQRARKGRRLTRNMQQKVRNAFLAAARAGKIEQDLENVSLFNYRP